MNSTGVGYANYFDNPMLTKKIGSPSPQRPDECSFETMTPPRGSPLKMDSRQIPSVLPLFKTLQSASVRKSSGYPTLQDWNTFVTSNYLSLFAQIGWGNVGSAIWDGFEWNIADYGPSPAGTGLEYGQAAAFGIYGSLMSIWEYYNFGVGGGPGTMDGTENVPGCFVLAACPKPYPVTYHFWRVSELNGSIAAYRQVEAGSGLWTPQQPLLIPLPWDIDPDSAPTTGDLTDTSTWNGVGEAIFVTYDS